MVLPLTIAPAVIRAETAAASTTELAKAENSRNVELEITLLSEASEMAMVKEIARITRNELSAQVRKMPFRGYSNLFLKA